MADQRLVRMWQRDAKAQVGSSLQAQIDWLETKRVEYSAAVKAGDWEVQSNTYDGASNTAKRHITDFEHHEAILSLIEKLEQQLGTGEISSTKGTVLGFKIRGILN